MINKGDTVEVMFMDESMLRGRVMYIPNGPGDAWVIENDDKVVCVQNFVKMTKWKREDRGS